MPFPPEQDQDSVAAWEAAHRSSLAQLEHQRLRSLNGTLLQQLGGNKWRVDNFALENAIQRVEKEGEGVKEEVDEVNRRRKADQEKAGETLSRLEKRWTELVSSGVQLEIGSVALCVALSFASLSRLLSGLTHPLTCLAGRSSWSSCGHGMRTCRGAWRQCRSRLREEGHVPCAVFTSCACTLSVVFLAVGA